MPGKVCLIVIDGWGVSDQPRGNAIHHAATPVMDELAKREGESDPGLACIGP